MKDFLDLCESRFAVRKFTDEPVSNEDLVYQVCYSVVAFSSQQTALEVSHRHI